MKFILFAAAVSSVQTRSRHPDVDELLLALSDDQGPNQPNPNQPNPNYGKTCETECNKCNTQNDCYKHQYLGCHWAETNGYKHCEKKPTFNQPNPNQPSGGQCQPTHAVLRQQFDAGYGPCETYSPGSGNHNYCNLDRFRGVLAKDVCSECCPGTPKVNQQPVNQPNPNQGNPNQGKGNPNQPNPNQGKGDPNQPNPNQPNPNYGKTCATECNKCNTQNDCYKHQYLGCHWAETNGYKHCEKKPVNQQPVNQPTGGNPNQANPNQGNPNQGNPNQPNPNQGKGDPNQPNPNQGNPNQPNPNYGKTCATECNKCNTQNDCYKNQYLGCHWAETNGYKHCEKMANFGKKG